MRAATAIGAALALVAVAPLIGGLVELVEPEGWGQPMRMASQTRVEGDPASDDEVNVEAEAAGESATIVIKETPAALVDQLPASEEVRQAHPMGPVDARMRLQAGPAVLEGPGELSPAFAVRAHVTVDEDDTFDRAWLRLDGQSWARLEEAGQRGDRRVLLAELDAGVLPAGSTTHVDAVFDRHLGPDVIQRAEGPGWDVRADEKGPPAPKLQRVDEEVRIEGEAARFEAQRRAGGAWQQAPVEDRVIVSSVDSGSQLRARGVDELGNPGAWSSVLAVPTVNETETSREPWRLLSPEDGEHVAGPLAIDWRPTQGVLVEVHLVSEEPRERELVGRSSQPPITWRTGFVPDGDRQLHVRALQEGNWTSRALAVRVDNLEEASLPAVEGAGDRAPSSPAPRTRSPWSAALATGVGLLAAGGLAGRTWTRRPK